MNTSGSRGGGSVESARLSHFEVFGLFGEFHYSIPINLESRITAIIAPNGSGKTICLRLINALFTRKWSFFSGVEFDRAEYTFTTGDRILVSKLVEPNDTPTSGGLAAGVSIALIPRSGERIVWNPAPDSKIRAQPLERYIGFLTRRGPNLFTHDYTEATYSFEEVIETFSELLPEAIRNSLYGKEPQGIAALTYTIDCHLIETQRLLLLRDETMPDTYRRGRPRSTLAISAKAQTLVEVIRKELTAYAALSQSLDRSFPKRVIGFGEKHLLPVENLKSQLDELDKKRGALMLAGILDSEIDDPVTLPDGPLESAIARVLNVYASDTFKKLDALTMLLERIELFVNLISERFSTKKIRVDKENGFTIQGKQYLVPLEKLSSGEQHQLVLFFELLFELKENALILIDEPELSLHVAWQKKFIADLNRIIALNQLDVILATHSAPLVSRWTDMVVELGKVDDE